MKHNRADLLKKFRDMIARGEPIIGGGAGTGRYRFNRYL